MTDSGITKYEPAPIVVAAERSIEELVAQSDKIRQAMERAMAVDQHYGIIPGAKKPSLWKPGAEKLCLLFRLDPQYHSEPVAPDTGTGGHLTVKSVCTLWHIPTGQRFGSGEASCSTRESKYAYRQGQRTCPVCGAAAIHRSKFPPKGQPKGAPGWYCYAKVGGCGKEFAATDQGITEQTTGRIANIDLADSYNTVLKMANKRALVAGILNVTAASDVFTQDLEDFRGDDEAGSLTDEAPPEVVRTVVDALSPPLDEPLERSLLLAKCKAAADKLKLNAGKRADILDQYGIRDPREASVDQLQAMLEHLRGLAPAAP